VHVTTSHRLSAPAGAAARLLTDPDFYLGLELPGLAGPEVLGSDVDGTRRSVRLRYTFDGPLDGPAAHLWGARLVTWTQSVEVDGATGVGRIDITADVDPRRLRCNGTLRLEAAGDATDLRFAGEFTIAVPGLGRHLERAVLPRLLHLLEVEAAAVDEQLPPSPAPQARGPGSGAVLH